MLKMITIAMVLAGTVASAPMVHAAAGHDALAAGGFYAQARATSGGGYTTVYTRTYPNTAQAGLKAASLRNSGYNVKLTPVFNRQGVRIGTRVDVMGGSGSTGNGTATWNPGGGSQGGYWSYAQFVGGVIERNDGSQIIWFSE